MKKLLMLAFTFTITFNIYAQIPQSLSWTDLELFQSYKLGQHLVFENGMKAESGTEYEMIDFYSLGVPVIYMEFQKIDCKGNEPTADLSLISIENSNVVIGAKSDSSCQLGLFVDLADIYSASVFLGE